MSHQIFSDSPQNIPSTSTNFDVEKLQRARRRKATGLNGWWIAGIVAGILVVVTGAVVCYFYFTTPYSDPYEDDNSYVMYDPETGNITVVPAHPVTGSPAQIQNMQEIEFVHPYASTSNDLEVPSNDTDSMGSASNHVQEHVAGNPYANNAFNESTRLQDVENSEMDEVVERENLVNNTSSDDENYEGLFDEVPAGFFRLNGTLHPMPTIANSNSHQSNNHSIGSYEG